MTVMRYPDEESLFLEFKREVPKNDQVIKTVIGFCNQKGGKSVTERNRAFRRIGFKFNGLLRAQLHTFDIFMNMV